MHNNKYYSSNLHATTTTNSFNDHNNLVNNFHVDNIPGPSNFLNNSTITYSNTHATDPLDELRSVNEILPRYRNIFASYPCFNIIQSQVFDVVLYSDESVVVSAPTGSGKTAIFELAIVRFLTCLENLDQKMPYKIVYVAPMKALCEERLIDWHRKFVNLGLTCLSVSGDSDNIDFQTILSHNLIITTPEKWDSLTRRWRDNKTLATLVKLFMIDEVHLLSEDHRGPTLEAVVCRMKTISDLIVTDDNEMNLSMKMRFVAVSASIPNAEDVAEWLSIPTVPARSFKFGDDMRPVKLKKVVLGYPYNSNISTPFKFDIMLCYKLQSVMLQYAEGKPTLIFCSTRKSVEMTSKYLIQNLTINLNPLQKQVLQAASSTVSDIKIRDILINGVCYHHAGLALEDRRIVEDLFRNANLPILVTTSTLAMGVNLPAHLVIIKSTKYYSNGEYQDYSESMLLQMIGRAGRPQFDTSATAVILTTVNDKQKYENLVDGEQTVESNLHKHLTEHLNAEVVLHTITDLGVAMEWLTSTFLYIRARKHPRYYGLPLGLSPEQIDKKLLDMCQIEINKLARVGMLTIDQTDIRISPTSTGRLMAKYYVAFDTMKLFTEVTGKEILQQILAFISKCREFSEIYLRVNDKKALNLLNSCRNGETIRFPYNGKIKTLDMKINCLIQAVFGCLLIHDQTLITESQKIMRIGERISKCLAEYLETKANCYSALLNALLLAKCFHARLWENSPFVSKQLSGIGSAFSSALVTAGKTSFKALLEANPRDIERILNRKSPMGNKIQDQVAHLPEYGLTLEEVIEEEVFVVNLKVCLKNFLVLQSDSSVNVNSMMMLLVGDADGNLYLYEKFTHSQMIEVPEITRRLEFPITYEHEIIAHFISEDWVGFDCNVTLLPPIAKKNKENLSNLNKSNKTKRSLEKVIKAGPSKEPSHIQTFMETYFKDSKIKHQKQKQVSTSRTLLKPKKSDVNKENNCNSLNFLNRSQSQNCDNKSKNIIVNSSIINTPERPISIERENSEEMITKLMEEKHMNRQNPEHSTINSKIAPKNQTLQKLIDESIQDCKKQKENFQQFSEFDNSTGFQLTESVMKQQTDSNKAALVCSNNYSATARRNVNVSGNERKTTENNFKPLFQFSHQTSFGNKKPKHRLKKNMNYTINFENSLYGPSLETDKESQGESIVLKFKYAPSKKYSHDYVSSQIKQEPEFDASANINNETASKYEIKDFLGTNLNNEIKSEDTLQSGESNFQKTLTWRSPLVISPLVRYSPVLDNNQEHLKGLKDVSFSSLNSNENITTLRHGNKTPIKFSVSVNNDSSETSTSVSESNGPRPTLRQNMVKKIGALPLSDEAHSQYFSPRQDMNTQSSIAKNNSADELISTNLLENLGLIQKHQSLEQISTPNKNCGLKTANTQTNFNNQCKKIIEKGQGITPSKYYSQLLLDDKREDAPKLIKQHVVEYPLLENKQNDRNDVMFQNPNISQSNLGYPKSTCTIKNNISNQDISHNDFDMNTSFGVPIFSPGLNKSQNCSTAEQFNQNILDFSQDQSLFTSQLGPIQSSYGVPCSQQPIPGFDLTPSHESRNRISCTPNRSFQQTPPRKRLGRYSSRCGDLPRREFQGFQIGNSANCHCDDCPPQEEFNLQQDQRPWYSHRQPSSSQMHNYKKANEAQFHRCRLPSYQGCSRMHMNEHVGKSDYFEQSRPGSSSSQGYWDNMNTNTRSWNSFGLGNPKRQKLQNQYRSPFSSRSYRFQGRDNFHNSMPNCYPQSDCVGHYPHKFNDEYEINCNRPTHNYMDKQFMLHRYFNSDQQQQQENPFAETSMNRASHGFGQEMLDFTIEELENGEDEDFSST